MTLSPTGQSYPALTVPLAVPAADSPNNVTTPDVVGNKNDTISGTSLYALAKRLDLEAHNLPAVVPYLAAGATVVSAAAVWTAYGALAQIVAAAVIASNFRVNGLVIETCNKPGVFQLQLYWGAADTVLTTVRYSLIAAALPTSLHIPLTGSVVPANSRIRAALSSSDGAANQCTQTVSITYTLEV